MTNAAPVLTLDEAQALVTTDIRINATLWVMRNVDFTALKRKLAIEKAWTPERCDVVELLYRNFLALTLRYSDRKICPTGPIDEFWHAHILDTEAYARDCDLIFGRFLHHFPYFGMRGPDDRADLERSFNETVDLFIRHFGIDPTVDDTTARSCRPQNCP